MGSYADLAAGGAEAKLYRFLRQVDRGRIEPAVTFLGTGTLERAVGDLGIRTYSLPPARVRQLGRALRTANELSSVLRSERPDVVLGWSHKSQIIASPAVRLARLDAKVAWIQTDLPNGAVHRLATRLPADAVICVSKWVAEAQGHLKPSRRLILAYPGVDAPAPTAPGELDRLRDELSIPSGRAVIGAVGRIEERKRQDLLIRAVARSTDRGKDVHGLIVGGEAWDRDARYRDSLDELIRELELDDRITFTGHVENPAAHMRLMDVYVHTCPVEAFGNALAEAMGVGLACVVVGNAGTAEVIEDGRSGLLVPRPDWRLVSDQVERLLDDPELRVRLAEAAVERQRQLFSTAHMTADFERLLTELATGTAAA